MAWPQHVGINKDQGLLKQPQVAKALAEGKTQEAIASAHCHPPISRAVISLSYVAIISAGEDSLFWTSGGVCLSV